MKPVLPTNHFLSLPYLARVFLVCIGVFLVACTQTEPEENVAKNKNSNTTNYSSNDHACLVEAMYFEARGTGYAGMRAVGETIINRKNSHKFPNSVCGVVDQRYNGSCQFSYRCDGIPEHYNEPAEKAHASRIADDLLGNRGEDITNGALFFHAKTMAPGWFGTLSRRGQFGGNIFYR